MDHESVNECWKKTFWHSVAVLGRENSDTRDSLSSRFERTDNNLISLCFAKRSLVHCSSSGPTLHFPDRVGQSLARAPFFLLADRRDGGGDFGIRFWHHRVVFISYDPLQGGRHLR